MAVQIPNFDPRPYQIPFLSAMDDGCRRAVLVWHRRAGKEIACWNFMIKQAYWHRVGTYVYFFPTSKLGRRILWDGMNKDGKRFIDYIPESILDGKPNSIEMKIRLKNGSIIQIIGTDTIVNVGINPVGCIFSEYSLQNPKAWELIRPILRENGGWSIFNFTPRGKNHAYDMFNMAKNNENWFCSRLTIKETGVLTEADMEEERREGMSDHMIEQEYYCSFDVGVEGSFYAKYLDKALLDGRIGSVPFDPATSVDTFWDLGVGDSSAILFSQRCGQEAHLIDMYQCQGEGIHHYAKVLQDMSNKYGWSYGEHWAPHDIKVRELGNYAKTRLESARELGINFRVVPNLPIIEGIEHGRTLFHRLWIDEQKCKYFIKCAENYHKHYNESMNVFTERPVHDWSSHVMDAYRMMAITYQGVNSGRGMTEAQADQLQEKYSRRYG